MEFFTDVSSPLEIEPLAREEIRTLVFDLKLPCPSLGLSPRTKRTSCPSGTEASPPHFLLSCVQSLIPLILSLAINLMTHKTVEGKQHLPRNKNILSNHFQNLILISLFLKLYLCSSRNGNIFHALHKRSSVIVVAIISQNSA